MKTDEESEYYSYNYWFEHPQLEEWGNGGEDCYINFFYEDVVKKLDIPEEGYIVSLGTHLCVSFEKLCKFFGPERCIGYDLYNPTNHPRVVLKNGLELGESDNIPIAFCHNDIGNFPTTPKLKLHAQEWAIKNVIPGGYFLGNNNKNSAGYNLESLMNNHGFENTFLSALDKNKFDLSRIPMGRHGAYMISKKII